VPLSLCPVGSENSGPLIAFLLSPLHFLVDPKCVAARRVEPAFMNVARRRSPFLYKSTPSRDPALFPPFPPWRVVSVPASLLPCPKLAKFSVFHFP